MTVMIPTEGFVREFPQTSKSIPVGLSSIGHERQPSDPFFYAQIQLQNIVVGSVYWIARESDHSQVLASGTAAASTVTLPSLPAYENPMLCIVRVRKSSTGTPYKPLTAFAYLVSSGVTIYIAQQQDNVAS